MVEEAPKRSGGRLNHNGALLRLARGEAGAKSRARNARAMNKALVFQIGIHADAFTAGK
jgi:hypothetical protein